MKVSHLNHHGTTLDMPLIPGSRVKVVLSEVQRSILKFLRVIRCLQVFHNPSRSAIQHLFPEGPIPRGASSSQPPCTCRVKVMYFPSLTATL